MINDSGMISRKAAKPQRCREDFTQSRKVAKKISRKAAKPQRCREDFTQSRKGAESSVLHTSFVGATLVVARLLT